MKATPKTMAFLLATFVVLPGCGGGGGGAADGSPLPSVAYFAATDGSSGIELWKTDGTAEGTVLVRDINPRGDSFPYAFADVDGVVYFGADDGVSGFEVWRTDGSAAGTTRVRDINPALLDSISISLSFVSVNGNVLFVADDGSGPELWKTDGTEAGTVLVKDIQQPEDLINVNGVLYFTAHETDSGRELWKSDGTEAGTVRVKDILLGAGSSSPTQLTDAGGILYFAAAGGAASDTELWKSDGTETGTVRVKDIRSGDLGSFPRGLTWFKNALYFFADNGVSGFEPWRSDGTDSETMLLKDIHPGSLGSNGNLTPLTVIFTDKLFFFAHDGVSGGELWMTDGTADGTQLVKDIHPGPGDSLALAFAGNDAVFNGALYFMADDGASGREIWKTNGTAEGTARVKDIRPGLDDSSPTNFTVLYGRLHFWATDGTTGRELWVTDGSDAGTQRVKDVCPGPCDSLD